MTDGEKQIKYTGNNSNNKGNEVYSEKEMTNNGKTASVNLQRHSVEQVAELMTTFTSSALFLELYSVGVEKLSRVLEALKPFLLRNHVDGLILLVFLA